ncbi:hypothetical protein ABXS75_10835 [Roseburia hominis]
MKKGRGIITTLLLAAGAIFWINDIAVRASDGSAADGVVWKTYKYTSDSPEQKENIFKKTIKKDGRTYQLVDVSYDVQKKNPVTKKSQVELTALSEPVKSSEMSGFAEFTRKDGVLYRLDKDTIRESGEAHVQKVTVNEDYNHAVDASSVPQKIKTKATNELTGEETEVECSFEEIIRLDRFWQDSYIDITFQQYDANVFYWQGLAITKNSQNIPLKGYETQLLSSVGLSPDTGRVLKTYWSSDEYTADGVVCRDAKAEVQKLVTPYRAKYSGEIRMPIYEATYTGTVEEIVEGEYTYDMVATAEYHQSHDMVYFVGIVVLILALLLILFLISKKRKRKEGEKTNV